MDIPTSNRREWTVEALPQCTYLNSCGAVAGKVVQPVPLALAERIRARTSLYLTFANFGT